MNRTCWVSGTVAERKEEDMNLTDEQVEAAAKELWLVSFPWRHEPKEDEWLAIEECYKQEWRTLARAAAPFVQAPWEMPTPEECKHAVTDRDLCAMYSKEHAWRNVLRLFVERRNAALRHKPVDPRREKIESAVDAVKNCNQIGAPALTTAEIADRILAALDAKE